jgi:hypothetical protein
MEPWSPNRIGCSHVERYDYPAVGLAIEFLNLDEPRHGRSLKPENPGSGMLTHTRGSSASRVPGTCPHWQRLGHLPCFFIRTPGRRRRPYPWRGRPAHLDMPFAIAASLAISTMSWSRPSSRIIALSGSLRVGLEFLSGRLLDSEPVE